MEERQTTEQMAHAEDVHLRDEGERRKKRILAITIVILIGMLGAIVYVLATCSENTNSGLPRNPNASIGQLEGRSSEEIQAELDSIVEEGMFDISISSVIAVNGRTAQLNIENVPGNRFLLDVTIRLDETGKVVYQSGVIEPNYHISTGELLEELTPGRHPAIATFRAFNPETEELEGTAGVQVALMVQD